MLKKIQNNKIIIDNLLPEHEAKIITDVIMASIFLGILKTMW